MASSPEARVFSPTNLQDALYIHAHNPDGLLYSGGTEILMDSYGETPELSGTVISLSSVPELKLVNRTERYLDLGAGLTVAEVVELGDRIVPACLIDAAASVARPGLRNLATIGGNIASKRRRMDLFPVMACLDAQAELRKENSARWLPVSKLFAQGPSEKPLAEDEIICRFRLPLDTWDLSLRRKVGNRDMPDDTTYVFLFLAKTSRAVISDIRVAYSGHSFFRDRIIESGIIGKPLPLSRTDAQSILAQYSEAMRETLLIPSARRAQFLAMLEWALDQLTE